MTSPIDKDILIIGGGMVGASMACALRGLGLRIGLVEAFPFRSEHQPSYDARCTALAYGSRRIFDSLHLWPALAQQATPIRTIHVCDRGHFGTTQMQAEQQGVEALGYVIENRVIGQTLFDAIKQANDIELFCPASLSTLAPHDDHIKATLEQRGQQSLIRATLVIAADGGNSTARTQLGIANNTNDYQQCAIISTVSPQEPHRHTAYERFTDSGPLALLPLSDNRCSLVLTVHATQVDEILALDDQAFLNLLQQRFGYRLGRFVKTAPRHSYPLKLTRIAQHVAPRCVFIGNAAHTLHPVAGQGFNLGLRDVAALAQVIADAARNNKDIGAPDTLAHYAQWREHDQARTARFTNNLVRIFSNDLFPLNTLRSKALAAVNLCPPLKSHVAQGAMGLTGKLTRLERGVPL